MGQTHASPLNRQNSTIVNPLLPGWHSDPSCIFVPERDSTFFCATSTFLVTPGIPIHASRDLVNWKLVSHALGREEQIPGYMNASSNQNDGIFAPTIRYHEGVFYVITVYVYRDPPGGGSGLIFSTTDPFDSNAWSDPVEFDSGSIDPDLFWHPNGQVYVTVANILQNTIDLRTGALGGAYYSIWNGTGGSYPEGPHIYFKDDWFYLLIGEGGTELNHSVTIARSRAIDGPYDSYAGNPILTARGTDHYFQTVGHADLFQDAAGHWWAAALSTRSGPAWMNYPMGRESVLTPVRWDEGAWPVVDPVFGTEAAWSLPPPNRHLPGSGPWVGEPDVIDFAPGSALPPQLVTWRWPKKDAFAVSPPGHPGQLRLRPSKTINSVDLSLAGADGLSLLMRLQTDTLFSFSVDVEFAPTMLGEEVGVTVFLTQIQHLDLGLVMLPCRSSNAHYTTSGGGKAEGAAKRLCLQLRLRSHGRGTFEGALPEPVVVSVPESWQGDRIALYIDAKDDRTYEFAASSARHRGNRMVIGSAPATIVSGGSGPFTGSLVGVYATSNEGNGTTEPFISRWRYTGRGQKIDFDTVVPS